MALDKYNILEKYNVKLEQDTPTEEELSFINESSSVIQSLKYPEKKTQLVFNFLSNTECNIVKLFFIRVTHKKNAEIYIGCDSTLRCVIRSKYSLTIGTRYAIYGKVRRGKMMFVDSFKALPMNYKNLCYHAL